jgi:hypothetical protein
MKPVDAFAEVGNLLTQVCGSPYRDTEMTDAEWDKLTDRILLLAEKEKADGRKRTSREAA